MNKSFFMYTCKILLVCILFSILILLLNWMFCISEGGNKISNAVSFGFSSDFVIDPGHGGIDGGAVSDNGILEKTLNLELSLTLYDFLTFCGYNCTLTRDSDSLVCDEKDDLLAGKLKATDLKNRLLIAQSDEDAVFVSIHMNKFPIKKYKGLQVYYSPNNESSVIYAEAIASKIKALIQPENTRRCKSAGSNIFILNRIKNPAVLVECGFLSNDEETAMLASEEYRGKLALIIAESIIETKGNN